MMKYFELLDDVAVPMRWHLGEVTLPDGTEPRLRAGIDLGSVEKLTAGVTRPGYVLDFSLTSFAVPVVTHRLAHEVNDIAGRDVQCIPVEIVGQAGMQVLNALRVIRCLDESQSEFIKWTERDHRPNLAGQYRQVTKLIMDPAAIPPDAHVFRIEGWLVALIVSADVKEVMERVGCVGAKFIDVTPAS